MTIRAAWEKAMVLCFLTLALITLGCGPGTPPPVDQAKAMKALGLALDAWKKGEKLEDLKQSQSIQMVEPAWEKGLKLKRFQIDEADAKPAGFDLGVPVKLWFENSEDEEPRVIRYTISTSPALVITRDYGAF